jgi:hypothetical protein
VGYSAEPTPQGKDEPDDPDDLVEGPRP